MQQQFMFEGKKPISDESFRVWTGITKAEFLRESMTPAFSEMRAARSKMNISTMVSDLMPHLRLMMSEMAKEGLMGDKNGKMDWKAKKEFLGILMDLMDKIGVYDADIAKADIQEEFDVNEAIKELEGILVALCDELECPVCKLKIPVAFAKQRLIRAVLDETRESQADSGPVKVDKQGKPVEDVLSVPAPREVVDEREAVPSDDRGEPVGEVGLVDAGFQPIGNGGASEEEGERSEGRNPVVDGVEERQGEGLVPEVQGEVEAGKLGV